MNFHVEKAFGWLYQGDVNIEHGGWFVRMHPGYGKDFKRKVRRLGRHEDEFVFPVDWLDVSEHLQCNEWLVTAGTGQLVYSNAILDEAIENLGIVLEKGETLSHEQVLTVLFENAKNSGYYMPKTKLGNRRWVEVEEQEVIRIGPPEPTFTEGSYEVTQYRRGKRLGPHIRKLLGKCKTF